MGALKTSSLSKKGQTTIPQEIREALSLKEGDTLIYEVQDSGQVSIRKSISAESLEYLKTIERTLANEWLSGDDDDL